MSAKAKSCYYMTRQNGVCITRGGGTNDGQCRLNIQYCKKDSDAYHKLCDRYWNTTDEEISRMSETEIDRAIEEIDVCVYMRERHMDVCIHPDCQDRGHAGAIEKIKTKMTKMKAQKYASRIQDLWKKISSNKNLTEEDIDRMIDESIKLDIEKPIELSQKRIGLPAPSSRNFRYDKFLNDIARNMNSKVKILEPSSGMDDYMVSIKLPSGKEVIGMNENLEDSIKEVVEVIVNLFGDSNYKNTYNDIIKKLNQKKH